jgi:hypothetical protein
LDIPLSWFETVESTVDPPSVGVLLSMSSPDCAGFGVAGVELEEHPAAKNAPPPQKRDRARVQAQ